MPATQMASQEPTARPPASPSPSSSTASSNSGDDGAGWEDAEPDQEEQTFVSLFNDETFPDLLAMFEDCRETHGFDFLAFRDRNALSFYDMIKLVNYIRTETKNGRSLPADLTPANFADDGFLKPVLEDDAVLFSLDDLPESKPVEGEDESASAGPQTKELMSRVTELEEELKKTQAQFTEYRETVKKTLDARWESTDDRDDGKNSSNKAGAPEKRDDDSHYFTSYSYNDIHETMLKDKVRTDAYRDFIYDNKSLFAGKVVLDVGCGTGILSMFCAKAGAAKVIAVDNSDIITKATANVFTNGFSNTITCIRGKIEEVTLPVDKVDIIVSEWMGYALLYEAMLDSVLFARDRYLAPGGLMVPSHMNLWVAPVADEDFVADSVTFWRDVYGFDMKAMQDGIFQDAQVLHMAPKSLCAPPTPFLQLSLHTTKISDLTFRKSWQSKLSRDVESVDAFLVWFDTFFMPSRDVQVPVSAKAEEWNKDSNPGNAFTTGPGGKETHWRQTLLLIDNAKKGNGYKADTIVSGDIEYSVASDNSRALDISMDWKTESETTSQKWIMR